jgi:hypothetical protein
MWASAEGRIPTLALADQVFGRHVLALGIFAAIELFDPRCLWRERIRCAKGAIQRSMARGQLCPEGDRDEGPGKPARMLIARARELRNEVQFRTKKRLPRAGRAAQLSPCVNRGVVRPA